MNPNDNPFSDSFGTGGDTTPTPNNAPTMQPVEPSPVDNLDASTPSEETASTEPANIEPAISEPINPEPAAPSFGDIAAAGPVAPSAEPSTPTEPAAPAANPATSDTTPTVTTATKKKSSIPVILVALAVLVAVGIIVVAVILSNQKKPENNKPDDTTGQVDPEPEPTTEVEYAAKDRLTKSSYDVTNLNESITLDVEGKYTFTPSANVTFSEVNHSTSNPLITVRVQHEEYNPVPVQVFATTKTISELDQECTQTKNCTSDYIDGAKTLLLVTTNGTQTKYSFYSKVDGSLLEFRTLFGAKEKLTESTTRTILIKAAMTITGKSSKPYIYDLATFFKLPNNKRVKSYKDIAIVNSEYMQIILTDGDNQHTITVYYRPIKGVAVSEISEDPKVGSFTYGNLPFFRLYDEEGSIDVAIATKTKTTNAYVKDLQKVQAVIEKIGQ